MIVFDIDGTIADASHRLHFITLSETRTEKNWDDFFNACGLDEGIPPGLAALETFLRSQERVELWTGRPERTRRTTWDWISRRLSHDALKNLQVLRMRPDGERCEDFELKERWLEAAKCAGQAPTIVFEDRQQVVDMFRRHGVYTCQVAKGDY